MPTAGVACCPSSRRHTNRSWRSRRCPSGARLRRMIDPSDTIVLFEKLAYEDLLPVRWVAHPRPVDEVTAQHLAERNVRVLQACDALEEYGQQTKSDDESPHSADLMRLDFKLNLLLDLAGQLLANSHSRVSPKAIRLNSMGATWKTEEDAPAAGTHGILEVG